MVAPTRFRSIAHPPSPDFRWRPSRQVSMPRQGSEPRRLVSAPLPKSERAVHRRRRMQGILRPVIRVRTRDYRGVSGNYPPSLTAFCERGRQTPARHKRGRTAVGQTAAGPDRNRTGSLSSRDVTRWAPRWLRWRGRSRCRTPENFFELGMIYPAGREVDADLVAAHKWFNIAASRATAKRRFTGRKWRAR